MIVSPSGHVFTTASVRRGVLPQLIAEVVATRISVKAQMGLTADPQTKAMLGDVQFALKMMANATYGYAGASCTGRMPCADVADSIVQTARQLLLQTIQWIEAEAQWQPCKVVYGDTDSVFVLLPGRSTDKAIAIGQQIARVITRRVINPIRLIFEKVYNPCALLTKKRYMGLKYELGRPSVMEYKGMEAIRVDQCPLVHNGLQDVFTALFETAHLESALDRLKSLCQEALAGRLPLAYFVYNRELRDLSEALYVRTQTVTAVCRMF